MNGQNDHVTDSHDSRNGPRGRAIVLPATVLFFCAISASALDTPSMYDPNQHPPDDIRICPTEALGGPRGGGMVGDGWDGGGQGAVTLFWHVEGTTPDFGAGQRTALIDGMQAWADVVQITFQELPIANRNAEVDWDFLQLNHCAAEPAECGDGDCPFDGPGGTVAHAGFPPGVNSMCIDPMPETFAGNVHFDEDEAWEQDNANGSGPFSLTLVACHELGHAIGLVHDTSGGGDVMGANVTSNDAFVGLSADDIANIRTGYAAGTGAVITLSDTGIWVNGAFSGTELGTPGNPFDTVLEGVNGVPPFTTDVVVHIAPGFYPETLTVQTPVTLENSLGSAPVTIGR